VERAAAAQLADDFAYIDKHLSNQRWVAGDHLTVRDFDHFVFGRLGLRVAPSTRDFPGFHRHTMEIASLAAAKSAVAQQGITLEGPATGPIAPFELEIRMVAPDIGRPRYTPSLSRHVHNSERCSAVKAIRLYMPRIAWKKA
jgi:hypothetical protein